MQKFQPTVNTAITKLSSQECTEVTIYNAGTVAVQVYDNNYATDPFAYVIAPSASVVFRGITDAENLSAKGVGASALIYYRAQFYAMHVLDRT